MNPIVKNIGELEGGILVFGGVYSNLEALLALYDLAKSRNIEARNIICTGDIVAYCANPEECLDFVKEWGIHVILGNVEIQLRDDLDDCGCNFSAESRCDIFSKQWFPFAKNQVSQKNIEWLKTLPDHLQFSYAEKNFYVVHGNIDETAGYIFKSSPWEEKQIYFDKSKADVILGGHCGLPFQDKKDELLWLNSGVIGMPANDGETTTWFAVLSEQDGFHFTHEKLSYDYQKAHDKMILNKLPKEYANTLLSGIWDNCDILPEVEKLRQ